MHSDAVLLNALIRLSDYILSPEQSISTTVTHPAVCVSQALGTAATTLAPLQRMPRATSQGLMPTGSLVLSRAVTPTTLAQATRAMATTLVQATRAMAAAATPAATLAVV